MKCILKSNINKLIRHHTARIINILLFSCIFSILFSQTLTEKDIKEIAEETNNEMQGLNIANGGTIRGCFAYGRTIVYQYDVVEEWIPTKNMKQDIIENFKKTEAAEIFFMNEINADFYYYTDSKLREKVSIRSQEFSNLNFDLGDYISLKGHPKAKDVDMKLKQPVGWNVMEGDRPNIVKKFVYKTNTFMVQIRDNMMFFSRNETKELLNDEDYVDEFITESSSSFEDFEILNHNIVTIDRYPTLEFTIRCYIERTGIGYNLIMKSWVIFYEDKIILLQCSSLDEMEFTTLENFYNMITNSVIFPEQYN